MNFKDRCKNCNKERGDHKAKTLECPAGPRTRIGYLRYTPDQFFEAKKKRKKVEGITDMKHIKSVPIPVDENKKDYKYIYCVRSQSKDWEINGRTWSFHDSLEDAIENGIYSWSDAESLYESGSYDYVVIQQIPLNHPMPSMNMLELPNMGQNWFKIVREEADKMKHDIRKAIVRCEVPEQFKRVIGFF